MVFKTLIFFAIPLTIASCAPVVGTDTWFKTASDLEKKSYLEAQCQKYGFTKGSNTMSECIQREANAQKDRAATLEAIARRDALTDSDKTKGSGISITFRQNF